MVRVGERSDVPAAAWWGINAFAAVLLFITACLALALLRALGEARPALLALCWIIAVACVSHALIDTGQE